MNTAGNNDPKHLHGLHNTAPAQRAALRSQLPSNTVQDQRTQLFDYLGILVRGKYWILGTFILVVAMSAVYTWTRPFIFEAKAKMLVSSPKQNSPNSLFGLMGQEERNLKNEIEIMRSKPLMVETAKALLSIKYVPNTSNVIPMISFEKLKESARPKTLTDSLDAIAVALLEAIQVTPIREADVVEVRARTNSPHEAALIVNTFVRTYQLDNEDNSRINSRRIREFLDGQVSRVQDTLQQAEGKLQNFMSSNDAVQLDEQSKNIISKISDFDSKYNDAKISSQTLGKTLSEYQRQLKDVEPEFSDNLAASANPYIESLQNQIAGLEVRRDLIITKNEAYASKVAYESTMAQFDQQINDLKSKLRSKTEELRKSKLGSVATQGVNGNGTVNPTAALNGLKQKIFDLQIQRQAEDAKVQALNSARSEAESDFHKIPNQVIDLARLERQSSSLSKLHGMLSEKLNEATIAEQSVFGNVRLFEPAIPNIVPVSPNRKLNIIIGCLFGLIAGIAVVIAKSFMDSTVRSPEDLENKGFSVLAAIPKIPRDMSVQEAKATMNSNDLALINKFGEEERITSHLISHVTPKSPIAESYRTIRTAIQFAHVDTHVQTVMIASSVPQEGKSTTSVNIATTLAQSGNKTLWIDCDLRRPVGHNVFHVAKEPGIVNLLVGTSSLDECLRPSGIENLDILTSGPIPPNPSELLGSQRMKNLLDQLKERYDNIIIDTPPVVAVTDAVILSTLVDAYILVARANSTHMEIVLKSRDSIDRVGGRNLGVVLNDYDISSNYGSYYKYYRYYKYENTYGEESELVGTKQYKVSGMKKKEKSKHSV